MHTAFSARLTVRLLRIGCCLLPLALGTGAALVLLLVAGGPERPAYASTLTFPGCASTIQGCIDIANPGDTILISAGNYTESLTLSKAVSLTGASASTTILHALPYTRVLTVMGAAVDSSVVISGVSFTGGVVTSTISLLPDTCGGGIFIGATAQPRLQNVVITHNFATAGGGGLCADWGSPLILSHVTVMSNTASYGISGGSTSGGGLYVNAAVTVSDSLFQGNRAGSGGGLSAGGGSTLTGTSFVGNIGEIGGGGGLAAGGPITLTGCSFISNTLLGPDFWGGGGGGLYVSGNATISGTLFASNMATSTDGGGLYANDLTLVNSTLVSNTAVGNFTYGGKGGGLYAGSTVTVTASSFVSNTAFEGGGLYAGSAVTMAAGSFISNAAVEGGGLWATGPILVAGTQFIGNAAQRGGGLAIGGYNYNAAGSSRLVNSLFAHNWATPGADVYVGNFSANLVILYTTFADPSPVARSAVYVAAGEVGLTNTIIASYTVGVERAGGTVSQDYNLFFSTGTNLSGTVGGGIHNQSGDPLFVNPAGQDFHLRPGSAARHFGVDGGVYGDIDGDPRPLAGGFDVGYDQSLAPWAAPDTYRIPPGSVVVVAAPGVLANDDAAYLGPLTAQLVTGPATGSLSLAATGAFTYTPPPNFIGVVTFTYQANDGVLISAPTLVTINFGSTLFLPLISK